MKGFKLVDGDVSITDNQIDMVENTELEVQTIQSVLQTNKGEDIFDSDEGINFRHIIGKGISADMVKTQIQNGINQVNPDYAIEDFSYTVDKSSRKLKVAFTARKSDGSVLSSENIFG